MNTAPLTIEKAKAEDAEAVWRIRYSTEVNAVALTKEVPTISNHIQWFTKTYIGDVINRCYVLRDGTSVVGYCRYDAGDDDVYVLSIALAAAYRGRGLGSYLLGETLADMSTGSKIRATVARENTGSQNLLSKFGFTEQSRDDAWLHMIKVLPV